MRIPRITALGWTLAALGSVTLAWAGTTLVGDSPFAPVAGSASSGSTSSAPEAYELEGSAVQGTAIAVCILDRSAHRSSWISVGETQNGIHVESYDSQKDKAVVTIAGTRRELNLKKPSYGGAAQVPATLTRNATTVGTPVAVTAPPPPETEPTGTPGVPAPPPRTQAERDQQEARMLVSDLLEIGMQQRKAYQEAKQKAAAQPSPAPSN
jgi:hypothetical protein